MKRNYLDKKWRMVNLLKLLIVVVILGGLAYLFPSLWAKLGFGDTSIFNVSSQIWLWLLSLGVLLIILYVIWIYLFYRSFWYGVGRDGIRIQKGIFTVEDNLIPYNKVRNVRVTSGLFQRLFGISTVAIELIGYTESDIIESEISGIENGEDLAKKIIKKVKI